MGGEQSKSQEPQESISDIALGEFIKREYGVQLPPDVIRMCKHRVRNRKIFLKQYKAMDDQGAEFIETYTNGDHEYGVWRQKNGKETIRGWNINK